VSLTLPWRLCGDHISHRTLSVCLRSMKMSIEEPEDLLVLDSRLAELSRVQLWADASADRLGLSDKTRYAIRLCLEEALANVILHGYRSESGHPIVIRRWLSSEGLFFAIEDKAPEFAPDDEPPSNGSAESPTIESLTPGGNGIRLLRHFAGSLVYEQLGDGNRLTFGFSIDHAAGPGPAQEAVLKAVQWRGE
jgi:serine/threonine-protein kinase RsbW